MNKFITALFLIFSSTVWACPNCAGSKSSSDQYTIIILGIFIILTYIPFYILFKSAYKHSKPKN